MKRLDLQENLLKYTHIENCPIRNIVSRFSGKWTLLVICVLSENESTRFNAIAKAIPDISSKVLSQTLRNLEELGIICRDVFPEIPPRVEYSLTDRGRSLMPHLEGILAWAVENYGGFLKD